MIAKSLVVHGSSRFLNTIYATDLSITDLTVTGTANLAAGSATSASLQLNSKGALYGYDNWLRINEQKQFASGVYFGSNIVRTDGSFQVGNAGASINLTSNATTGATFKVPINMNGTTYKWTTNGNIIVNGLTASTGLINSLTADEVFVTNKLRALEYDIQTIANLGGSFIVAPTLNCSSTAKITVTALTGDSNYNFTGTIVDSAISSSTFGGATWSSASKIKISGKINGTVIGTCDGELTAAMNTTANTLNFKFYSDEAGAVSSVSAADVTVMLTTVGATNPVGIYMTSYDTNGYSHISLYGGTAIKPTVRIGNMQGLDAINGTTPTGWGIYTNNGYFSGVIVSESGKIGGWSLGDDAIYSSTKNFYTTNNMYFGASGLSLSNTFKVTAAGALTATGADITGAIKATSGTIGSNSTAANRWQIGDRSIYYGNATPGNNTSTLVISTGTASTKSIGGSDTTSKNWMLSAGTGFGVTSAGVLYATGAHINGEITATSGTIGSNATAANRWQIGDKAIFNTTNSMTSTGVGTYVGVDGIRNYKSATAYVNIKDGVITALGANITGTITATTGTFGNGTNKITVGNGGTANSAIYYGMTTLGDTAHDGFYIGTDGIALGKGAFKVTNAGALSATSGSIGGNVTIGGTAASTVLTNITNAATTATKYITYVDTTNGIRVYDGQSANQNKNFTQINSSGMQVYRGGTANTNIIASFGEESLVGGENDPHLSIKKGGLSGFTDGGVASYEFTVSDVNLYTKYRVMYTEASQRNYDFTIPAKASTDGSIIDVDVYVYGSGSYNGLLVDGSFDNGQSGSFGLLESEESSSGGTTNYYITVTYNGSTGISITSNISAVTGYKIYVYRNGTKRAPFFSLGAYDKKIDRGGYSLVEGYLSSASGNYSHAEGYNCNSDGTYSHSEGHFTSAHGNASHAQNVGTSAASYAQTAIGKYNKVDSNNTYAFIIGNGSSDASDALDNAFTVAWNGDTWMQGDLYVGGEMYDGTIYCGGIDLGSNLGNITGAGTISASSGEFDSLTVAGHASEIGHTASGSKTANLANSTSMTKAVDAVSLGAGTWIVTAGARFTGNATGTRALQIYVDGSGDGPGFASSNVAGSGMFSLECVSVVSSTSSMDIDLYARQNSGGALSVTYYWSAVRIA